MPFDNTLPRLIPILADELGLTEMKPQIRVGSVSRDAWMLLRNAVNQCLIDNPLRLDLVFRQTQFLGVAEIERSDLRSCRVAEPQIERLRSM